MERARLRRGWIRRIRRSHVVVCRSFLVQSVRRVSKREGRIIERLFYIRFEVRINFQLGRFNVNYYYSNFNPARG